MTNINNFKNIDDVENFIRAVEGIQKKTTAGKKYIIEMKNGRFSVESFNKKEKTLNTEKIATLAVHAFATIKTAKESPEQQAKLLEELSRALRDYKTRVNKSKNFFSLYASKLFHGLRAKEEKVIRSVIKQAETEAHAKRAEVEKKNLEKQKKILRVEDALKAEKAHAGSLKPSEKIAHFYLGVLDSTNPADYDGNEPGLDGVDQTKALRWYISHLNHFRMLDRSLEPGERTQIDNLIKELEYALEVSLALRLMSAKNPKVSAKDIKEVFFSKMLDKIENLPVGERVILPGGYHTFNDDKTVGGHAVMYIIGKAQDGTYTFEVINTGEGSTDATSLWGNIKNIVSSMPEEEVTDIKYEKIDKSQFSEKFVDMLLEHTNIKNTKKMDGVIEDIQVKLNPGKRRAGRKHRAQKKASCTHKSISSTVKGLLPPKLYWKMKSSITEQEIKNMKKLKKEDIQKSVGEKTFSKMLEQAETIQKKRTNKSKK